MVRANRASVAVVLLQIVLVYCGFRYQVDFVKIVVYLQCLFFSLSGKETSSIRVEEVKI